jgi:hypothetical protein
VQVRGVRRFAALALIAWALAWGVVLAKPAPQVHPIGTTDLQTYELATGGQFRWLPVQHVVYEDRAAGDGAAEGYYRPDSGEVVVVLREGSLSRDEYVRILRHEYGHALLFAWCIACDCGEDWFQETLQCTSFRDTDLPKELQGPAAEYRADPGRFGSYARCCLCEWMAEAYASYVADEDVPAQTRSFFESLRSVGAPRLPGSGASGWIDVP